MKKTSKESAQGGSDELPKNKKVRKKRTVSVKKGSTKVVFEAWPTLVTGNSNSSHPSFPIVGIGASAGGLEAFETFFSAMPADSGMAFVLVAHLSPTHASLLPELLQRKAAIPVCQVQDNMAVQPNHVYIIPPNKDLCTLHGVLHLMELSRPRVTNLPIDSFFRSLAQDQGSNAICIVLSGTGTDGSLGVRAIKGAMGMVMVQDEQSAKYDGMPRSAIATQLADYVLPPEQMPQQLINYVRYAGKKSKKLTPETDKGHDALNKIFIILRARTDHDFSQYKNNTICRRIERRMDLHQITDISDYVRYLQESDREVDTLYKELLIGVTHFFRDSEAFNLLKNEVLPEMIKGKREGYNLPGLGAGV